MHPISKTETCVPFSPTLSSSILSLSYYTVICPPSHSPTFLYSLSLCFSFVLPIFHFLMCPKRIKRLTRHSVYDGFTHFTWQTIYLLTIFSLVLSTTSKMHMLIWLHHCSFKVPLMRDMILLWSPVWWYDSLRGLCVEKRDDCFDSVLKGRGDDG